jgi:hypothetical protein
VIGAPRKNDYEVKITDSAKKISKKHSIFIKFPKTMTFFKEARRVTGAKVTG